MRINNSRLMNPSGQYLMTAYLTHSNRNTIAKAANGFKMIAIASDICSFVMNQV